MRNFSEKVVGQSKTRIFMFNNYRISRPIRRAVIFSLEILEKKIMNVF